MSSRRACLLLLFLSLLVHPFRTHLLLGRRVRRRPRRAHTSSNCFSQRALGGVQVRERGVVNTLMWVWRGTMEGWSCVLTLCFIAVLPCTCRTMKGAETVGEFFATFLGINQSRYQWVIDAKKRDDERAEQEELENKQRRWLIAQAKLRRASMAANEAKDIEGSANVDDTKPNPEEKE